MFIVGGNYRADIRFDDRVCIHADVPFTDLVPEYDILLPKQLEQSPQRLEALEGRPVFTLLREPPGILQEISQPLKPLIGLPGQVIVIIGLQPYLLEIYPNRRCDFPAPSFSKVRIWYKMIITKDLSLADILAPL